MNKPRPLSKTQAIAIGDSGEKLVKCYLLDHHWQILAEQWHSRWGELDLIAYHPVTKMVAFVEVKTRRPGSLDQQGILAITPTKQRKIIKTALQFLAEFPVYENCGCRFDIALVTYGDNGQQMSQFTLAQYLESAFDADSF